MGKRIHPDDMVTKVWERSTPNYIDPDARTEAGKWSDRNYELIKWIMQLHLSQLPLPDALRLLFEQQLDVGFVVDDLKDTRYFFFPAEAGSPAYFSVQFNPRRAERQKGAGRIAPPPGVSTANSPDMTCFLCEDNIRWQQRGVQLCYPFDLHDRRYHACANPFPFAPEHLVIASSTHQPQSWHTPHMTVEQKLRLIVEDALALVTALGSFVVFYNGVGAGATIPNHFHYHCFSMLPGQPPYPLQVAARGARQVMPYRRKSDTTPVTPRAQVRKFGGEDRLYPLVAYRITGEEDLVADAAVEILSAWDRATVAATANVIALMEEGSPALYIVPRSQLYDRSPGMVGLVGGLEVLGVFVFSSHAEEQAIHEQRVDFRYLSRILQAVKPPGLHLLDPVVKQLRT